MSTQQAWDDFNSISDLVVACAVEIGGTLKGCLNKISDLFNAIVANEARMTAVISLADTHPVYTATYLTTEVGKILVLRDWLIANGYMTE